MIKFFRRIRFELMEQSKIGKYLKYAIGEIVLVVIGILIALSINNWNEDRKNAIEEIILLNALQEDINFNIEAVNKSINNHAQGLLATKEILRLYTSEISEITDFQIDTLITQSKKPYTLNLKTGMINSIISSGEIKLIRNDSIKKFITSFDNFKEDAEEGYLQLIEAWEINLIPRIVKYRKWMSPELAKRLKVNYNLVARSEKNSSDYKDFFQDPEIMNLYLDYYQMIRATIEQEKDLLNQLKMTNEFINQEISK